MNIINTLVFFLILLVISTSAPILAQTEEYISPSVEITASRYPDNFADMTKSVSILDSVQIARLPVSSSQELLGYCDHVDLQRRGSQGIQSDLSLRGGSFEETLILLDGMRINDPQTGHHNLDLPLSTDDIQRIEFIRGSAAAQYGAQASAGVIRIITKSQGQKFSIHSYGGQNDLLGALLSGTFKIRSSSHRLSTDLQKCGGYRYNTDFKSMNFFHSSSILLNRQKVNIRSGHQNKWFGANGFYSSLYPEQRENTGTTFIMTGAELQHHGLSAAPAVSWRRHSDDYQLDRTQPHWFHNQHVTQTFSVEVPLNYQFKFGLLSTGFHARRDWIESNSLGNHRRKVAGVHAGVQTFITSRFVISGAANLQFHERHKWQIWPEAGMSYWIKKLRLFASYGRSFRMPSFTELYYNNPASIGNPDLKHSATHSAEMGAEARLAHTEFAAAGFIRQGENVIDWVRASSAQPWQVMNIAGLQCTGVEFTLKSSISDNVWLDNFSLTWTWLHTQKETYPFESRYALNFLRHHIRVQTGIKLPFNIKSDCFLNWQERNQGHAYWLMDMSLHRSINCCRVYCKISNAFNTSFEEISGVPMPGRWLIVGVRVSIKE